MRKKNRIYILGHKNPDTDSICSAIALAYLKNHTEEGSFVAKRAGQMNEETEYVLKYFKMAAPGYLPDVGTQVKDMEIRPLPGVSKEISVRKAWDLMQELNAPTASANPPGYSSTRMSACAMWIWNKSPLRLPPRGRDLTGG